MPGRSTSGFHRPRSVVLYFGFSSFSGCNCNTMGAFLVSLIVSDTGWYSTARYGAVPLPTGILTCALFPGTFCLFFPIEMHLYNSACYVTRQDFREITQCEDTITTKNRLRGGLRSSLCIQVCTFCVWQLVPNAVHASSRPRSGPVCVRNFLAVPTGALCLLGRLLLLSSYRYDPIVIIKISVIPACTVGCLPDCPPNHRALQTMRIFLLYLKPLTSHAHRLERFRPTTTALILYSETASSASSSSASSRTPAAKPALRVDASLSHCSHLCWSSSLHIIVVRVAGVFDRDEDISIFKIFETARSMRIAKKPDRM